MDTCSQNAIVCLWHCVFLVYDGPILSRFEQSFGLSRPLWDPAIGPAPGHGGKSVRALVLACVISATPLALAERSEQELIEEATSALPAHLRAEAGVVTTRPDATEQLVRKDSNGFICSTDGSSDALYQRAFKVACRELSFHRYRAQILPILRQTSDPAERLARIEAGIEAGSITPPTPGAQGYYLSGPDRESATLLVVIMLPGATAESTGLPTQRSDRTWLMCPGTPAAHIMIGDVPYGQDEDYWKTCGRPVSPSN